jgi:hypothetical protein
VASPAGLTRDASSDVAGMQHNPASPGVGMPCMKRPMNLREIAIAANQCTHDIFLAEMRLAKKELARREAARPM